MSAIYCCIKTGSCYHDAISGDFCLLSTGAQLVGNVGAMQQAGVSPNLFIQSLHFTSQKWIMVFRLQYFLIVLETPGPKITES